ncbi:MAG: hypothetical protein WBQ20_06120 [Methyloceanibacter sp.]|jgi:hypothetical protein
MLRLRAWVFFAILLLIGALLVSTAPSFQACLREGAPQATTNTPTSEPQNHGTSYFVAMSPRGCLGRFFTENREDIIAAFALILALSTIFLWLATRDLVAGTADFSKTQLRAYLGPSETFITGVEAGARPMVECAVRNFGQTPAHRASYWAETKVLDSGDRFEPGRPEDGERTVNPGRDGFTIKSRLAAPLTEEEMSKIKLGTAAIYFYGAIAYRDAFGRSRKTQFRYQHGGARVFGTEDMVLSPKGNRAT